MQRFLIYLCTLMSCKNMWYEVWNNFRMKWTINLFWNLMTFAYLIIYELSKLSKCRDFLSYSMTWSLFVEHYLSFVCSLKQIFYCLLQSPPIWFHLNMSIYNWLRTSLIPYWMRPNFLVKVSKKSINPHSIYKKHNKIN